MRSRIRRAWFTSGGHARQDGLTESGQHTWSSNELAIQVLIRSQSGVAASSSFVPILAERNHCALKLYWAFSTTYSCRFVPGPTSRGSAPPAVNAEKSGKDCRSSWTSR